jgi:hypothetical protein
VVPAFGLAALDFANSAAFPVATFHNWGVTDDESMLHRFFLDGLLPQNFSL